MSDKPGRVYIVGAGPGDAGLMTLRGAECLAESDIVIYDYLANESLLSHAPSSAEKIYVGKTAGQHTKTQEEINKLLYDKSRKGKIVTSKRRRPFRVRTGGEEAIYLAERHIEFEVIPGVTSALAVPAYAGIPVTQRNMNVSFHVITGHEDPEKDEPDIEWKALGQTEGTLIFLMGIGNLANIVKELVKHGRAADTPVALIRWGTLPEQETLVSTLERVVEDSRRENFNPPAIVIIGAVVELRPLIQWVERKPLFGVRAAVTRPEGENKSLIEALRRAGADVIVTPTIKVVARSLTPEIKREVEAAAGYEWIVFTSTNAVRIFFGFLFELKQDARALSSTRVAAIGDRTADALKSVGIRADIVPREFAQEGLAKAIRIAKGDRVLIPRASSAREVLEEELRKKGQR